MKQIKCTNLLVTIMLVFYVLSTANVGAATYNSAMGELSLPSLVIGEKTLTNVIIKLNPNGSYAIKSGTESALPFICPGEFSKATFDLIKSKNSFDEINKLLKCQWLFQQKHISESDTFPINSTAVTWVDKTCSSLSVSILDISGDISTSASIDKSQDSCNTAFPTSGLYDIQSKAFLLSTVIIDNSTIASEVVIKFHSNNQYELLSFATIPRANPPIICNSLTEAAFNDISTNMSSDEVSNLLGCQWQSKSISEDNSEETYNWTSHECNRLYFIKGFSKTYTEFKSGGCGSFVAH